MKLKAEAAKRWVAAPSRAFALLVLATALSPLAPSALRPPPKGGGPFSGGQVLVLQDLSRKGIRAFFKRCAREGIGTVAVRMFHNKGDRAHGGEPARSSPGLYFRHSGAPLIADLPPLLLLEARRRGVSLWGWITTRKTGWLLEAHPEWRETYWSHELSREAPGEGLDIFNREAVEAIAGQVASLAATGVDGILLQDDLALPHNGGFGRWARASWAKGGSDFPSPGGLFANPSRNADGTWAYGGGPSLAVFSAFKCGEVARLAGMLSAAAKRANPRCSVAVNLYPEALLRPDKGMEWFAQDASMLAASGADRLCVMAYEAQWLEEYGAKGDPFGGIVGAALAVRRSGEFWVFKTQARDWSARKALERREVEEAAKRLKRQGAAEVWAVPLEDFLVLSSRRD